MLLVPFVSLVFSILELAQVSLYISVNPGSFPPMLHSPVFRFLCIPNTRRYSFIYNKLDASGDLLFFCPPPFHVAYVSLSSVQISSTSGFIQSFFDQSPEFCAELSIVGVNDLLQLSALNSCLISPSAKQTAVQVYDYPKVTYTKRRSISRPRHLKPILSNNIPASKIHFIHYLPVELLSLIFIIGSKQDSFFPIVISHVCSAWRQIALRTPELWCRILLSPQESMWRERVRRSRACFLDIQLCSTRVTKFGFHRSQDLDPYSVNWYMQIVFPHIRRWRSLDIDFTQQVPHLWKAVLAGCFTPAPWLEELSLKYRLNDDTREFFLFASFTPRLRRLRVDGIRLIWTPSLFGNLTFLDYTHHGFTSGHQAVQDVISILVVTSRITELRVLFPRGQIACLPSRREVVTQRATLPFLNHLVLKVDGSDIPFEIAHLVTLISSPTLSILRLIDLKRAHDSFQSLKSFFYVYPLPPSLRFIYIGHAWYDPSMVHAMVHSLPRLWKILIRRSRLPEQVLYLKNPTIGMDGPINHAEEHKLYQSHLHQLDVHYFPVCSK